MATKIPTAYWLTSNRAIVVREIIKIGAIWCFCDLVAKNNFSEEIQLPL